MESNVEKFIGVSEFCMTWANNVHIKRNISLERE